MMDEELVGYALRGIDADISDLERKLAALREHRARLSGVSALPAVSQASSIAPTNRGGRRVGSRMTPEARKRLSESMRARWVERKKKGKTTLA